MRLEYDERADAIYIYLSDAPYAYGKNLDHERRIDFAKGGTPVRTTADMVALLKESVQFALSGTNVSSTFEVGDGLHNSEVDHNQINQVVVLPKLPATPILNLLRPLITRQEKFMKTECGAILASCTWDLMFGA